MENIEHYLRIMNIRYGNVIKCLYDVPGNLEQLFAMKMLVQPLVENAIVHGLRPIEGEKRLRIGAALDQSSSMKTLKISVEDNGVGFSEEEFQRVMSGRSRNKENGKGIGLKNVDERVRRTFGTAYGIRWESPGAYSTRLTLLLPEMRDNPHA